MARTYKLTAWRRLGNWLMRGLLRIGAAPGTTYLLTVRGRTSGKPRSTPVNLVEGGGQRWLVAPYGEVAWVRNARAAGQVTLSRGRRAETVRVVELGPEERAPVLKQYLARNPITRSYFDATPESPLEAFQAEAARHPVFRIVGPPQPAPDETASGDESCRLRTSVACVRAGADHVRTVTEQASIGVGVRLTRGRPGRMMGARATLASEGSRPWPTRRPPTAAAPRRSPWSRCRTGTGSRRPCRPRRPPSWAASARSRRSPSCCAAPTSGW